MTAKKVVAKAATKKGPAKAAVKKAPAKKAPAKKAVVKKAAAPKKAAPAKKAAKPTKAPKKLVSTKGEAAFKQIEQEAYYIAEKDGFSKDPLAYWCEAEVKLGMRKA